MTTDLTISAQRPKLNIDRETLRTLTASELRHVVGGSSGFRVCHTNQ